MVSDGNYMASKTDSTDSVDLTYRNLMDTYHTVPLDYVVLRGKILRTFGRIVDKTGDKGAVIELLISVLQNEKNDYLRVCAAESLGEFKDKRAMEPLIKLLKPLKNDNDKTSKNITTDNTNFKNYIRCYAITILGKTGDTKALELLVNILLDTNECNDVRANAAHTLKIINENKPWTKADTDIVMSALKSVANDNIHSNKELGKYIDYIYMTIYNENKKRQHEKESKLKDTKKATNTVKLSDVPRKKSKEEAAKKVLVESNEKSTELKAKKLVN